MTYLANECSRESWPSLITLPQMSRITSLGYEIHLLLGLLGEEKSDDVEKHCHNFIQKTAISVPEAMPQKISQIPFSFIQASF